MRNAIFILLIFTCVVFAEIRMAGITVTTSNFRTSTENAIAGLLTTDPNIDLILGPSEALGGADSNKARFFIADSAGFLVVVPADTFNRTRQIKTTLDNIRNLARTYSTTILPGTIWIVDVNYRCFEAMPIIYPDGTYRRFRRKAHQKHTNPLIDPDIRLDTVVTNDGHSYTFLLTISNESRDLPTVYRRIPSPADIWLLSARRWAVNFDRIAKTIQENCPPTWSYIATYFATSNFRALLDSGWVKPSSPLLVSVLYDTAGATFAGNLVDSYRPNDDWFVYSDYRITSNGVIVTCDPHYPPRTPHGIVVRAKGPASVPVESVFVRYKIHDSATWYSGWTDARGLFQFHICASDSYNLEFTYDSIYVMPPSALVYSRMSEPRCTVDVLVRIPTEIEETRIPDAFSLSIFPNPFNSSVRIEIRGLEATPSSPAEIEVFNLSGRKVLSVSTSEVVVRSPNDRSYEFIWSPDRNITSGIHFIRVKTASGQIVQKRLIYLK